jgi:hypothetical protein
MKKMVAGQALDLHDQQMSVSVKTCPGMTKSQSSNP